MRRARLLPVLSIVAVALASACSTNDDGQAGGEPTSSSVAPTSSTTTAPPLPLAAPAGEEVYTPPDPLPGGDPGDLIWAQPVDAPEGVRAWRVLYLSEAVNGDPIAVTGVVAAPEAPAPEGGRPVLTWAHGTSGTADQCAPSKQGVDAVPAVAELARRGWVGVATDYEGLGTPGLHPYLVGESEGRGVLDIVRAAGQIDEAGASGRVVVMGVSQGGHAALFAGQIAADYAPELDVRGVVAAAPPGDLKVLGVAATAAGEVPGYAGFLLMAGGGYQAAYGDVSLDELVPADILAQLDELLERECTDGVFAYAQANPVRFTGNLLDVDPWPRLLEENSVDGAKLSMPVLVLQGEADRIVPQPLTDALARNLCADGVELDYRTFPAAGHGEETAQNFGAALDWAAARFEGAPAGTTCSG